MRLSQFQPPVATTEEENHEKAWNEEKLSLPLRRKFVKGGAQSPPKAGCHKKKIECKYNHLFYLYEN